MAEIRDAAQWEQRYKESAMTDLGWYFDDLDPDLKRALSSVGSERRLLDLGSGPGTQSIALANIGFDVLGTDVSPTAVEKARKLATDRNVSVRFEVDDILNTTLSEQFEVVVDRGCFHVFAIGDRPNYVAAVTELLVDDGLLLLKCFSHLEPEDDGPNRVHPDEIRGSFEKTFEILSIDEAIFQGTRDPLPQALFCTMRKRSREEE